MSLIEEAGAVLGAAGLKFGVLVSSTIGGLMSLRFFEGDKASDGTVKPLSGQEKWVIALSGSALGIFLSGGALAVAKITDETGRIEVGLGILISLFGMSLAASIIKAIRETNIGAAIESWIKKR